MKKNPKQMTGDFSDGAAGAESKQKDGAGNGTMKQDPKETSEIPDEGQSNGSEKPNDEDLPNSPNDADLKPLANKNEVEEGDKVEAANARQVQRGEVVKFFPRERHKHIDSPAKAFVTYVHKEHPGMINVIVLHNDEGGYSEVSNVMNNVDQFSDNSWSF